MENLTVFVTVISGYIYYNSNHCMKSFAAHCTELKSLLSHKNRTDSVSCVCLVLVM